MRDGRGDTGLIEGLWGRRLREYGRVWICNLVEKLKEAVGINKRYGFAKVTSEQV